MSRSHPTLVWLRPDQVALVSEVARRCALEIACAGGPGADRGAGAAQSLGAPHADDLRAALASSAASVAFLADPGTFGDGTNPDDHAALRAFAARGGRVFCLEPCPASLVGAAPHSSGSAEPASTEGEWARFGPLARLTRGAREAAELGDDFGPVRSMSISALGSPAEGSLGARLYDAADLVLALMGRPETLDAAYVGSHAGRAVHALPGETLRGLHGDMTLNLRFADGRAAVVHASDQAGRWERSVLLLGRGGRVRVRRDGIDWTGPDGQRVDTAGPSGELAQAPPSTPSRSSTVAHAESDPQAVDAISEHMGAILHAGEAAPRVPNAGQVLAIAQTALLSARTRESENLATIYKMTGLDPEM